MQIVIPSMRNLVRVLGEGDVVGVVEAMADGACFA